MYVTSWFNRDSCRLAGRREAEDRQKISDAPHGSRIPSFELDAGLASIRRDSVDVPAVYRLERHDGSRGSAAGAIRRGSLVRGWGVWRGPACQADRLIGGRHARRDAIRVPRGCDDRTCAGAGQGSGNEARDQAGRPDAEQQRHRRVGQFCMLGGASDRRAPGHPGGDGLDRF